MMEDIEVLARLIDLGTTGIFLLLFFRERQRNAQIREEHIRDLRYIASIRHDAPGQQWNGQHLLRERGEHPETEAD
jgi:hypothetical protein